MERKITIEESVPYTEDYQNKMLEENQVEGLNVGADAYVTKPGGRTAGNAWTGNG